MKYKYQKHLNPLMSGNTAMGAQALKTPQGMSAKANPVGGFSENAMEYYSKRSKHGSDPNAGVKYAKYRRRKYSHV